VDRNGGRRRYRAQAADAAADRRARRPKAAKLVLQPRLRAGGDELALRWSPQQIAGWLPLAFPEDPVMRVSRETVYLSLFAQVVARCVVSCSAAADGAGDALPAGKRLPQGCGQPDRPASLPAEIGTAQVEAAVPWALSVVVRS
jgi:hypothetical protein